MTLIIGIRCTDGVVMGADGAMTFAYGNDSRSATIMQTYRQKIKIYDRQHLKAIVAGSGEIGLSQRFENIVDNQHWSAKSYNKQTIETGTDIASKALKDFAKTKLDQELVHQFSALMAMPHKANNKISFELIEFSSGNLRPEVKQGDNWYVSIGSGKFIADTLLGFMRSVYWKNEQPDSQNGIFVTHLILKLACEMAPSGIAPPIQLAVLSNNNESQPLARVLTDEELQESLSAVENALEHYGKYPASQLEGVGKEPPIFEEQ